MTTIQFVRDYTVFCCIVRLNSLFTKSYFIAKPCGPYPRIRNAHIVNNDQCKRPVFKTQCEYECKPGFRITSKSNKITCGSDGFWSTDLPTCTRMVYLILIFIHRINYKQIDIIILYYNDFSSIGLLMTLILILSMDIQWNFNNSNPIVTFQRKQNRFRIHP